MAAKVLDGKAAAAAIKAELAVRVAALRDRGIVPGLGTLLVGEGLAIALGLLRTRVSAASVGGVVIGFIVVQLVVMAIAWGRVARLYGLSALARDTVERTVVKVPKVAPTPPVAEAANESMAVA